MANVEHVPAHFKEEDGNGKRQANPQPPGHVLQFRALAGLSRRNQRLESHPAYGTVARANLTNLRVHGAGVCLGRGCYRWVILRVMMLMTSTLLSMKRVFPLHRVLLSANFRTRGVRAAGP